MKGSSLDKKEKSMCENTYMLGVLATEIGKDVVSIIPNGNDINFYIKPISDETEYILNEINSKSIFKCRDCYIGIDVYCLESLGISSMEYNYKNANEKIEIISNKLMHKLILFKPIIREKDYGNGILENSNNIIKNVEIISAEEGYNVDSNYHYLGVPKVNLNNDEFEKRLLSGDTIQLKDYNHQMLPPECIICGQYIYCNFKSWEKDECGIDLWVCNKKESSIKKIKFEVENLKTSDFVKGTSNLIFISDNWLNENVYENLDGEEICVKNEEINFLERFENYIENKKLYYDRKDLINFHVSVKTNPLTIVAGMSGTGKTQLARAYAKSLGLSENRGTLLFLPISPSYTEPEDLTGYLNNTTGLYISSETGLIDFLINAENESNKIHMIIFDEMNLAQVEHWFSQFISLLEIEAEERKLSLYGKNSICHNEVRYKRNISIGDNIIFIGTVNLDETTKEFSDRLLDRANIVTLKKKNFEYIFNSKNNENDQNKTLDWKEYSFEEYNSWINKEYGLNIFTIHEIRFLDNLHKIIQKYDYQKGISFRVAEKIGLYINNIPKDNTNRYVLSRKESFDIQVRQRILTKIKGTKRQFDKLIGEFDLESEEVNNSELYKLFQNENFLENVSEFNLCKMEIKRKAKELSLYGYTS